MSEQLKELIQTYSSVPFLVSSNGCWIGEKEEDVPFSTMKNQHFFNVAGYLCDNERVNLRSEAKAIRHHSDLEIEEILSILKELRVNKWNEILIEAKRRNISLNIELNE